MADYSTMTVVEVFVNNPLTLGSDFSITYTRKFKVKLRDTLEAIVYDTTRLPYDILKHDDIPKFHENHPSMFGLWVTNLSLSVDENEPNTWEVEVTYEAIDIPKRGLTDGTDYASIFGTHSADMISTPFYEGELPWHQAPKITVEDAGTYEEVAGHAFAFLATTKLKMDSQNTDAMYTSTGSINYGAGSPFEQALTLSAWEPQGANTPITNVLGDPYTDTPAIVRSMKTYTWQWYMVASGTSSTPFEDTDYWKKWQKIGDTINSKDIRITGINISAFTGKVKSTTQELLAFMGFPYYKLGLTVEIREGGWVTPILNDGSRYKPSVGAQPVTYNNEAGGTPTVKLDPSGVMIETTSSDISTPYWNFFVMSPWKDWSFLGLPSRIDPTM